MIFRNRFHSNLFKITMHHKIMGLNKERRSHVDFGSTEMQKRVKSEQQMEYDSKSTQRGFACLLACFCESVEANTSHTTNLPGKEISHEISSSCSNFARYQKVFVFLLL
eukprot:TRINITY_DN8501_c0_g1_i2.p1 TRINITY_DN8501_c0_g1~~TRINITY_DN8501_c0_g1_i2.p1  ORF type:complete len:109 (-),score=14.23 TRINITY_DN8501_c0_g1_i2:338-664(-)